MSQLAKGLFELLRLSRDGSGCLTSHLLKAVAEELISEGVAYNPPGKDHEGLSL